jgi:hypothetical protein
MLRAARHGAAYRTWRRSSCTSASPATARRGPRRRSLVRQAPRRARRAAHAKPAGPAIQPYPTPYAHTRCRATGPSPRLRQRLRGALRPPHRRAHARRARVQRPRPRPPALFSLLAAAPAADGRAAQAYGGIRHLNGYADRAPVRANISLGDSLAGLHAAFGAVMALLHRQAPGGRGAGQARGSPRLAHCPSGSRLRSVPCLMGAEAARLAHAGQQSPELQAWTVPIGAWGLPAAGATAAAPRAGRGRGHLGELLPDARLVRAGVCLARLRPAALRQHHLRCAAHKRQAPRCSRRCCAARAGSHARPPGGAH